MIEISIYFFNLKNSISLQTKFPQSDKWTADYLLPTSEARGLLSSNTNLRSFVDELKKGYNKSPPKNNADETEVQEDMINMQSLIPTIIDKYLIPKEAVNLQTLEAHLRNKISDLPFDDTKAYRLIPGTAQELINDINLWKRAQVGNDVVMAEGTPVRK